MIRKVTIEEALSIVEKVQKLIELNYNDKNHNRYVAIYDLTRKIRACLNTIYLLPIEQYDVLCIPANLLYRCIITDLITSLFISVIDDTLFDDAMHILDIGFTKSLKNSLEANIKIRKETYPDESNCFDELSKNYQIKLYDDLKDCLNSDKGEEWRVKNIKALTINGVNYKGHISEMYDILNTYDYEERALASIYHYYRLLSQSEHYSMKGRVFNYNQGLYLDYYNKILGYIYHSEKYIYKKYSSFAPK